MQAPLKHIVKNQTLWLSAERCLFWEEQKALIVSDLHFGKTGHFRKSGIAVPQNAYKHDLQRLIHQVLFFKADKLIVVGDFFHSKENKETEFFKKWRHDLPGLEIHLVKGNHDILNDKWYNDANLLLYNEQLNVDSFCFQHDIQKCKPTPPGSPIKYVFTGHIHPGVLIKGLGKQALQFPCFYFTSKFCVLPAFSHFTGLALINALKHENIFAIVENKVVQLQ